MITMYRKLEEISTITTGVYEKPNPTGDTLYLQVKHFDDSGKFRQDWVSTPGLQFEERLRHHLLKDGDVLLVAKGENNKACLYRNNIGRALASSVFFVIRTNSPGIMPEYLQWYFNTAFMKNVFSGLSKGTHIASLSKKTLSEIEIPIPPLQIQKEILDTQRLIDQEKSITTELMHLKDNLYQKLLLNLANNQPAK